MYVLFEASDQLGTLYTFLLCLDKAGMTGIPYYDKLLEHIKGMVRDILMPVLKNIFDTVLAGQNPSQEDLTVRNRVSTLVIEALEVIINNIPSERAQKYVPCRSIFKNAFA